MISALSGGLALRPPTADDHPRVLSALGSWWGGFGGEAGAQQRALLLPRLFFQHFTDTSEIVERPDGQLTAFLIGFLSQSHPDVAYIHFVGVDPTRRRTGIAAELYARFCDRAARRGARLARCLTSPANTASLAFHTRIGFQIDPADTLIAGVPAQLDYDGPGLHRVTFTRALQQTPPTVNL